MSQIEKLTWWEPSAKRLPEIKQELAKIYSPAALTRIVVVVVAIVAIAPPLIQRYIPELEFNWLTTTLKALGIGFVVVAASALVTLLPRCITVTTTEITVTEGQHTRRIKFSDVAVVSLNAHDRTLCILRYSHPQPLEFYLSQKVNLADLRSLIETGWQRPPTDVSPSKP
jgi:hypothetical protein